MDEAEVDQGDAAARAEAVKAVITNAKRLIRDAEILIANGSAGSALSLAILAYEEAGKGHILELNLTRPKTGHTLHEFRHAMALQVLAASLTQKYGLDMKGVLAKLETAFAEMGLRPGKGFKLPPITENLRAAVRSEMVDQLKKMNPEEFIQYGIEMRWLNKIAIVVQNGGLEKLRQSGLYLDTDPVSIAVTSSPMTIDPLEAQRWVWAATRILNLLERGVYHQPYSPLSELMEAMEQGDEVAKQYLEMLKAMLAQPESASRMPTPDIETPA